MDQIEVSNLIKMNVRVFTDLDSKKQSELIPKKNYIIMLTSHMSAPGLVPLVHDPS